MAHFAKVIDGIVVEVHVVEQDFINSGKLGDPNNWIQTSYNTRGGVHYAPNTHEPDGGVALRKNYAGKGYTYDQTRDAFIPPKPDFTSWVLNEDTCRWEPPVPQPDDYLDKDYQWNEATVSWVDARS